jgi:hypothetical protein
MSISEIITYILAPVVAYLFKLILDTRAALFRDYQTRAETNNNFGKLERKIDDLAEKMEKLLVEVVKNRGRK